MSSSSPPVGAEDPLPQSNLLHRGLGVPSIVLMVVAAAAPLAVVAATTPIVAGASGSIGVPLFFIIAAAILLLFTVGYALMSRYVPNAGAFYAYVQEGLGRTTGLGAATLAIFSYSGLLLATTSYIGAATRNVVLRYSDFDAPWWAYSVAVLLLVAFLGYRDIELSSKVLGVLLCAESMVIVVLDAAILVNGGPEGISGAPLSPVQLTHGAPGLGLMFAFFAFFGFEATAVFRSEAKDPDRTIARATYIAVLVIGVFYAVSGFAVIVGTGASRALEVAVGSPENMVLDLATTYVGTVFHDLIQVLLVSSLFACILSFHNVVTRYVFSLSGKAVLPQRLGTVSSKHSAPSAASAAVSVGSAIAMVFIIAAGLDPVSDAYVWLSGAATLGLIGLMTLASVAIIVFFRRSDLDRRRWPTLIAPALATLGLGAVLALVIANFTQLIPDSTAAWIVSALVVGSFLIGIVLALRLRRTSPQSYAALLDRQVV